MILNKSDYPLELRKSPIGYYIYVRRARKAISITKDDLVIRIQPVTSGLSSYPLVIKEITYDDVNFSKMISQQTPSEVSEELKLIDIINNVSKPEVLSRINGQISPEIRELYNLHVICSELSKITK